MVVFSLIPVQHSRQLAAIGAEPALRRALTLIDPEAPSLRIVADMAHLHDHQIFPMMRMRAKAVGRHLAADPAVVEGERAEMLRKQNDRILR
jgi:hypothetical protein